MDTDRGSSGSPVILYESLNVIGIHKPGKKIGNNNVVGTFIGEIIQEIQKDQINEIKNFHNNKNDIINNKISDVDRRKKNKDGEPIDMNCSSNSSSIINQINLLINDKQVAKNTKELKKKNFKKNLKNIMIHLLMKLLKKKKYVKK